LPEIVAAKKKNDITEWPAHTATRYSLFAVVIVTTMFLGHANSDPNNVHRIPDFMQESNLPEIPLKRYPPHEKVLRYYAMAKPDFKPDETTSTAIFVGQVPNMMPLPYLAWAIDTIVGRYIVTCVKHAKKSGCAVAWVRTEECPRLYEHSRSVLFDVTGYWCPADETQKEKLEEYTQTLRAGAFPDVHKDGRIPKSCMVFEELGRPRQTTQPAPELGHLQIRGAFKRKNSASNATGSGALGANRGGGLMPQSTPMNMMGNMGYGMGMHMEMGGMQMPQAW
jgi:hypothetical protein